MLSVCCNHARDAIALVRRFPSCHVLGPRQPTFEEPPPPTNTSQRSINQQAPITNSTTDSLLNCLHRNQLPDDIHETPNSDGERGTFQLSRGSFAQAAHASSTKSSSILEATLRTANTLADSIVHSVKGTQLLAAMRYPSCRILTAPTARPSSPGSASRLSATMVRHASTSNAASEPSTDMLSQRWLAT